MFKKNNLVKELHLLEEEIKILEIKRSRSQASLIEALISKRDPDEADMQFFRTYSAEIEIKREQLQKITAQLEKML
ncbi:MAG: hypothetical protein K2K80_01795 [Clostridia bacterium]|nr:hypothetical protein [Clostridia bacterium]